MKEININKALGILSKYKNAKEAQKSLPVTAYSFFDSGIHISVNGYNIDRDIDGEILSALDNVLKSEISELKSKLIDLGLELDE